MVFPDRVAVCLPYGNEWEVKTVRIGLPPADLPTGEKEEDGGELEEKSRSPEKRRRIPPA